MSEIKLGPRYWLNPATGEFELCPVQTIGTGVATGFYVIIGKPTEDTIRLAPYAKPLASHVDNLPPQD